MMLIEEVAEVLGSEAGRSKPLYSAIVTDEPRISGRRRCGYFVP